MSLLVRPTKRWICWFRYCATRAIGTTKKLRDSPFICVKMPIYYCRKALL
jgi:hypothetical protein